MRERYSCATSPGAAPQNSFPIAEALFFLFDMVGSCFAKHCYLRFKSGSVSFAAPKFPRSSFVNWPVFASLRRCHHSSAREPFLCPPATTVKRRSAPPLSHGEEKVLQLLEFLLCSSIGLKIFLHPGEKLFKFAVIAFQHREEWIRFFETIFPFELTAFCGAFMADFDSRGLR